ncbi:WhiB family transcriptional regulator [Microbacterium sp. LWH12-1.2]|uniref:WhiB family transcriptional regulator n=1 Tax=Microbacterium sp. LWH12-1.2 TaxID=3135259 RepID=UPI00341ABF94
MRVYTDNNLRPEPWVRDAACATTDVDLWFPAHGDQPTADKAKRVCREVCPVREQCLEFALRTRQNSGIWAGYAERTLRSLRRNAA